MVLSDGMVLSLMIILRQEVGSCGMVLSLLIILHQEVGLYCMVLSCLLYTSPSPRDKRQSRMPSSA